MVDLLEKTAQRRVAHMGWLVWRQEGIPIMKCLRRADLRRRGD
jgi:hypothetical protein